MSRNLFIIILVAAVFALLVPMVNQIFSTEWAFTPDNLVKVDIVSR